MKVFKYLLVALFLFFMNFIKAEEKINYFRYSEFKSIQINSSPIGEILSVKGNINDLKLLLGKKLKKTEGSEGKTILVDKKRGLFVELGEDVSTNSKMQVSVIKMYKKELNLKILNTKISIGESLNNLSKMFQVSTINGAKTIVIENREGRGENIRLIFDNKDTLKEVNYTRKK